METTSNRFAWKRAAALAAASGWGAWHVWHDGKLPGIVAAALALLCVRMAWVSLGRLQLVLEIRDLRKTVARPPVPGNLARLELLASADHRDSDAIMNEVRKMQARVEWAMARQRLRRLEDGRY